MAKSTMGLWPRFVLASVLIVMAGQAPARADTLVTVEFKGTGFSGSVVYDQSLSGVQQGANYVFSFQGASKTHALAYTGTAPGTSSGLNSTCEPFTITNSGTTFTVTARVPQQSPPTAVTVVLHTNVSVSSTVLPLCDSGSTSVFQQTGTFKLVNQSTGDTIFSGTISSTTCSSRAALTLPIQTPLYTADAYAAPCPVYACPPRPACCLTRFFARLTHPRRCW